MLKTGLVLANQMLDTIKTYMEQTNATWYKCFLANARIVIDRKLHKTAGHAYPATSPGNYAGLITLSEWATIQWSNEEFMKLVCHEMAHALCSRRENPGKEWIKMFKFIMSMFDATKHCTPDRCYKEENGRVNVITPLYGIKL